MDIVEDERFIEGVRRFDDRDFAEAAELFEELYFEYTMQERELTRAMMQLAVGCHHLAMRQWRPARERLEEGVRALTDPRFVTFRADCTALMESIDGVREGESAGWPVFRTED